MFNLVNLPTLPDIRLSGLPDIRQMISWFFFFHSSGRPIRNGSMLIRLRNTASSIDFHVCMTWQPCNPYNFLHIANRIRFITPGNGTAVKGSVWISCNRVVCPNFRHPALTPSFTKYKFLQVKNSLQHLWMNFQFWNCFSFRMASYCFRSMTYSLYKMRKPRMTKLGQGVGVRAHCPITLVFWRRILVPGVTS